MSESICGIVAAPSDLVAVFEREGTEESEPIAALALVRTHDGSTAIFAVVVDRRYPGLFVEADKLSGFLRLEWRQ